MKFSLRFVLVLVAAIATTLALWRIRPPQQFALRLTASGTIVANDSEFQISSATSVLKRASAWRRVWLRSPHLTFQADTSSKYTDIQRIIDQARTAGFAQVSVMVADDVPSMLGLWAEPASWDFVRSIEISTSEEWTGRFPGNVSHCLPAVVKPSDVSLDTTLMGLDDTFANF